MNTLWIRQWNAYLRYSVGFFVMMVFSLCACRGFGSKKKRAS